jgi:hypothetical protein
VRRWHVSQLTRDDCLEAFRLIDEVLQRDPKNAMALADLAFNWHMGGILGWTKETPPEANELTLRVAQSQLTIKTLRLIRRLQYMSCSRTDTMTQFDDYIAR